MTRVNNVILKRLFKPSVRRLPLTKTLHGRYEVHLRNVVDARIRRSKRVTVERVRMDPSTLNIRGQIFLSRFFTIHPFWIAVERGNCGLSSLIKNNKYTCFLWMTLIILIFKFHKIRYIRNYKWEEIIWIGSHFDNNTKTIFRQVWRKIFINYENYITDRNIWQVQIKNTTYIISKRINKNINKFNHFISNSLTAPSWKEINLKILEMKLTALIFIYKEWQKWPVGNQAVLI